MLTFTDTSHIDAPPERVWRFFAEMGEHYRAWHPEHLAWREIEGDATRPGSVIFADEWLGPVRLRGRIHVDHVEPERFFDFRFGPPFSLVNAGGFFRITPTGDGGCDLLAETHFGSRRPRLAALLDPLFERLLPVAELRRHMAEEGVNLNRLIGGAATRQEGAEQALR